MNYRPPWMFLRGFVWILAVCVLGLSSLPASVWGVAQLINGDRTHAGATNYGLSTGTGAAYVLTLDEAIPGYAPGACYLFKAHVANTGPATININGRGARNIVKFMNGAVQPLVANDIGLNQDVQVCDRDDGTTMQGMNLGGGGVQPLTPSGSNVVTGLNTVGQLQTRQLVSGDLSDASSLATATNPLIFENKRWKPTEVALVLDGSNNVAVNLNAGHLFVHDALPGNPTFLNPTGTAGQPYCSQEIGFRLKSSAAVARTLTWGNAYRGRPALPLPTTTSADGTTEDDFKFRLNCVDNKWVFMSSSIPTGPPPVGGGGGTGYMVLPLTGVKLPSANATGPSVAGESTTIWFDETSPECVRWEAMIPGDYTSTPVLRLRYVKATSTTTAHIVAFDVRVWDLKAGASVQTTNFGAVNNCDDTSSPNAVNVWDEIVCTLTNFDTASANSAVEFEVCSDPTTGTWTGDLGLNRVRFEYAR